MAVGKGSYPRRSYPKCTSPGTGAGAIQEALAYMAPAPSGSIQFDALGWWVANPLSQSRRPYQRALG